MRSTDILSLIFLALAVMALLCLVLGNLSTPVGRSAASGDEITTEVEPLQKAVSGLVLPIRDLGRKRVHLQAVAAYSISGVLASKHAYRLGAMDRLAPWDYAIAWGEVPKMFPWIKFRQSGRFCRYKYKPSAPVDGAYLQSHMSNNHLIPANKNIRRALRLGKKGMKVRLEGYLVNVKAIQKEKVVYTWDTSSVRTDTGFGACEIIFVRKLRLDDTIYE